MNVNRPFGDGRDANNNGVVDEPVNRIFGTVNGVVFDNNRSELANEGLKNSTNQWSWLDSSLSGKLPAPAALDLVNGTDVNGDGVVDAQDQLLARQLYARHLYVIARLMIDDNDLLSANWFP